MHKIAEAGWRRNKCVCSISSAYQARSSYYGCTSNLTTPREIIRYVDSSSEKFFRLIVIDPDDPSIDYCVRFKSYLGFREKAHIVHALSDVVGAMKKSADKTKLLEKVRRIKHSGIYVFPSPKIVTDLHEAIVQPPLKEFEQPLSLDQLKYRLAKKYGREYKPTNFREDIEDDCSSSDP